MPVHNHKGRNGAFRNFLFQLRKKVPSSWRLKVWRWTARKTISEVSAQPSFFRSIELETRTRCNSKCSFCAANVLTDQREDKYMPEELYLKILAELTARDYDGAIKFFVNNEPLLDVRTPTFISLARRQVPRASTEVHTNGLKLNPKSGRELLEAGLQLLVINNYSTDGAMHRGVRKFLDEVAPEFPECEIHFHSRMLEETLQNRAGTAPNLQKVPAPLPLSCRLPFEEMVVTADGRVTICCQDHYFDSAVGNINQQSMAEIWNGEAFRKLRGHLREADRSQHALCAGCDFRGFKDEQISGTTAFLNRMVGNLWQN